MTRQPLPSKYHNGPWALNNSHQQNTELMALIGQCLTSWPEIDLQMALLLGVLLNTHTEAALALYTSLENSRTKSKVLEATAKVALKTEKERELFQAILKTYASTVKLRNDLAHGTYGICSEISDGILWLEVEKHANWNFSMCLNEPPKLGAHAELGKEMFVYRKKDLQKIFDEILSLRKILFDFICYLRRPDQPSIVETQEQMYLRLCNEPHIKQELSQIRKKKSEE